LDLAPTKVDDKIYEKLAIPRVFRSNLVKAFSEDGISIKGIPLPWRSCLSPAEGAEIPVRTELSHHYPHEAVLLLHTIKVPLGNNPALNPHQLRYLLAVCGKFEEKMNSKTS